MTDFEAMNMQLNLTKTTETKQKKKKHLSVLTSMMGGKKMQVCNISLFLADVQFNVFLKNIDIERYPHTLM